MIKIKPLELVCPAGTPAAFEAAVLAGADSVYCGFRNETNARNFPGLNFAKDELRESVKLAKDHGTKVLVAINTYPTAGNIDIWYRAIDDAAQCGAYAVILADLGLIVYARYNVPEIRRHLSVQAAASSVESLNAYASELGVTRAVLPRVLSIDEIKDMTNKVNLETEVFAFGGLCTMVEGKCSLSSWTTGLSPNKDGVCSPAEHVHYKEEQGKLITKLGNTTLNIQPKGEAAGYPTICKGRFNVSGKFSYIFEEPTSLSLVGMLPELMKSGVTALKIEGRQRGKAYVTNVVKAFKHATQEIINGRECDLQELQYMMEGKTQTSGAYEKNWL